jgi:sugar O-acyltransferase (sialic acid O-acetyltransferase NeuD family)
MKSESLIIIGGGGQCKSSIDIIIESTNFKIIGILENENTANQSINGIPIIGTDDDYEKYVSLGYSFHIAVGQLKSSNIRFSIFSKLKKMGAKLPSIVSKFSHVSRFSTIGEGTIISHNVVVNSNTIIGSNCIINTGCIIEHDCIIGDNNHISTSTVVNGNCKIGNNNFIGSNSVVINNVFIPDNCIVGAGSVVIKGLSENSTYIGNPAKVK